MIIHNMEQYSPEWWATRLGVPTASRADKIITAVKGELSSQHRQYINELCADMLGLGEEQTLSTGWMQRGHDLEDEAGRFFTFETGHKIQKVGFLTDDDGNAGASADALVEIENLATAGLEIKCPKPSTHIGYLLNPGLPDTYKQQVHWSLAVTQLPAWYWMSYHPELDPVIVRVEPDDYTAKVKKALDKFTENRLAAFKKLGITV